MPKRSLFIVFIAASVLLAAGHVGDAAGRHADRNRMRGDGGRDFNLTVREMKVSPIRAHVGDVISITMVVQDLGGELFFGTQSVNVLANRKVVSRELVRFGMEGDGGRIRTLSFRWDTRNAAPGEYRIRGELFLWEDSSLSDNFLDVDEPLVLVPAGAAFPGGESAGGVASAVDPRWKTGSRGGIGNSPSPQSTDGY